MRRWLLMSFSLLLLGCATPSDPQADPTSGRASLTGQSQVPAPVTVAAVGDIACTAGIATTATACRHAEVARQIADLDPDRLVALGDLQYEKGTFTAFQNSYDRTWGRFNDKLYAVPGNHEYRTTGASGFYRYTGLSAPGYRVKTLGAWRLYLLNSNCTYINCARQLDWLAADLADHPTKCALLASHHPRFSSGEHGNQAFMQQFWRVAYRYGVDVALGGHDHNYERFRPMTPTGVVDTDSGITSFVVGTGGRQLRAFGATQAGSVKRYRAATGALALTLHNDSYQWRFENSRGELIDSGSRDCS